MKIIHVISGLYKGGGQRVAIELANKAAEKGDEVTMLAAWPVNPEFLEDQISKAVKIKFIGRSRTSAYLKMIPWIIRHKTWITSHDVLHCHLTYGAFFGAMVKILLAKIARSKTPIVVETYHAVGMPIPKFDRWLHTKLILPKDGIVLMAKDPFWSDFIDNNPDLENELIPNGIALLTPETGDEQKLQYKRQIGIPESSKYLVGTASMLRPERKNEIYIPICKKINEALGSDAHFVLCGDGTEFERIKLLKEENKLSGSFFMPGVVKYPSSAIVNFDIYVSVSVGETAGISMIEAAMCKVPVVAIQLVDDYETNEADWFWSHTDLDKVAEKIVYLLQHREERLMLAAKQYDYVTGHFSSDAMYKAYHSFYERIERKNS